MKYLRNLVLLSSLVGLTGCGKVSSDITESFSKEATVSLKIGDESQIQGKSVNNKSSNVLVEGWGVLTPMDLSGVSCYAVAVALSKDNEGNNKSKDSDDDENENECEDDDGKKFVPGLFQGLYTEDDEIEIKIPSGRNQRLYLLGYAATDISVCVNLKNGAPPKEYLSAPLILGEIQLDLSKGARKSVTIVPNVEQATLIKECKGPIFNPPPAPVPAPQPSPTVVPPTPVPSPTPTPTPIIAANSCPVAEMSTPSLEGNESAKKKFIFSGADQTYTVPAGVHVIEVKMWAAGGGGSMFTAGGKGGGGAFVSSRVAVTPGQIYKVVVGQGGQKGVPGVAPISNYGGGGLAGIQYSGGGGGRSALLSSNNKLFLAAGAGGGAAGDSNAVGSSGGAGGANGEAGEDGSPSDGSFGTGGGGATSTAGGIGGTSNYNGTIFRGNSGSCGKGGDSDSGWAYGDIGGGGGGYFGGGASGGDGSGGQAGGGGGGSSYAGPYGRIVSGYRTIPGNTNDSDYVTGIGAGGNSGQAGGHGLVVIREFGGSPAVVEVPAPTPSPTPSASPTVGLAPAPSPTPVVTPTPNPSPTVGAAKTEMHMIGIYQAATSATTWTGSGEHLTAPVHFDVPATVHIRSGSTPIVVVLSAYEGVIWNFTGDVSRVEKVVAHGNYNPTVNGIAAAKVETHSSEAKTNRYYGMTISNTPYDINKFEFKLLAVKSQEMTGAKLKSAQGVYSKNNFVIDDGLNPAPQLPAQSLNPGWFYARSMGEYDYIQAYDTAGSPYVIFYLKYTTKVHADIVVNVKVEHGTTDDADIPPFNKDIKIPSGSDSVMVLIPLKQDKINEGGSESFKVKFELVSGEATMMMSEISGNIKD